MTEAEWLACAESKTLLASLFARSKGKSATDERFRWFAVACCRRVAEVLEFGDTYALDCLEIYATSGLREALLKARRSHRTAGTAASNGLSQASDQAGEVRLRAASRAMASSAVWTCTKTKPTQAAMAYREAAVAAAYIRMVGGPIPKSHRYNQWLPPDPAELATQTAILRDIFGSLFRPVVLSSEWRTDTAVSLAREMYESRDFGAMPILADALQDAGCDSDDILSHCRDANATHVRGCWVVDLVLGKE